MSGGDESKTVPLEVGVPARVERVLVIGDGAVARALCAALQHHGNSPQRWWRSAGGAIPAADVVVLAVSDSAIAEVAARVMAAVPADEPPPVLLHTCGALESQVVLETRPRRPLGRGLLHPLVSLAGAPQNGAPPLYGAWFAVEGDEAGRSAARRLAVQLGARDEVILELTAAALPLYHAAAVLVANHTVALVDAAAQLLIAATTDSIGSPAKGATSRPLAPLAALLASTARNLATVGLPAALTGPIARGEPEVVERHLAAIAALPSIGPELVELYKTTGRRLVEIAGAPRTATAAAASPGAATRLRALLK